MNQMTIWFTSDTHGYLFDTNFSSREPRDQGLLGFSFEKDGNTLVIDGGDTIQGSPLTNYCQKSGEPLPFAEAMNALGYDYVIPGNHDFNCGSEYLASHLSALNARCLCANVTDAEKRLPIFPTAVHTLENGLRVGLVGIVTDWINIWEKPENLRGLTVSEPLSAAKEAVKVLRAEGIDVLVGIYHGGVERDLETGRMLSDTTENIACRLCEEIPFDLLLTGHQHIGMVEKHWNGVHIVQTPCNATQAVKVVMDETGAFHSELVPSHSGAALSPTLAALRQRLERWLDEPIGTLSHPIWPGDRIDMAMRGSDIADFFNAVQLWASGADISCAALPNELRGFDSSVTVRDVVASYVYSNTLVVLEVTGKILRQALEQCATYFDVKEGRVSVAKPFLEPKEAHFNYDFFSGIEYVFDLTCPVGSRVRSVTRNGVEVRNEQKLTLVLCDYRATGSGDFGMYIGCPRVREIQTEVSQLIIDYMLEKHHIDIPSTHPIHVIL